MNNYKQTLDYLFSQLPMYQREGKAAYKADLNNTWKLMDILEHPYKSFRSIHVAGTNGKGSTSHMLASVFQEAGYKVGLYTSPHLVDFRERVRINGEVISESYVVDFVTKNKLTFESINLSFFEWTVGLAFDYFANQKVDIAIVEVGMGGRLDSTNVLTPELSVITNIGLDHTQFLGDSREKIAGEKGGIIKPNIPVVIGQKDKETEMVFRNIADQKSAPITFAEDLNNLPNYESDLLGNYQRINQRTVLAAISILSSNGYSIDSEYISNGLKNVIKNTGLKGRWQVISESPLTICDTAHNEDGLSFVMNQLTSLEAKKIHFVIGMVNDKSIENALNLFPKTGKFYFCQAQIPRALNDQELYEKGNSIRLTGKPYGTVKNAYQAALKKADKTDVIYIGGSTFVVADFLAFR
ncbi:MAG: bifunctional folylpolyglutamate synthase/dihydrofolate synthase [Salibacteraceae bacterium]